MNTERTTAARLLLRHFVRRLLDNDLLSANVDRRESMALVCAVVVSLAVFVTFFLSVNYLAAFIQLPGPTALSALSDRFLFVVASMTLAALAALMVWDALALEPRDAAILGPLPIEARTITRAKLGAALAFGAAVVVALNAVPSVLYPMFLTLNLRGLRALGLLRLVAGHATTMVMAGLCGFFGVLALRGLLRTILGERGFRRVSSPVQSALVAACVTALLLTPTVRAAAVRDWIGGAAPPRWPVIPALWYLSVNETLAGSVIADAPVVTPHHVRLAPSLASDDEAGRARYRALRANFVMLARMAWLAFPSVACVAVATFLWNNRRFPDRFTGGHATSRVRVAFSVLAEELMRSSAEAQAGFFFTLQALARSGPHRMIVAVSSATALTLSFVAIVSGSPVARLALQVMVLSSLIGGFRYAITVPVELTSNWTIQMAWLGDERSYLAGVKHAAVTMLVALPLLLLLPVHVAWFGAGAALVHSLWGFLLAVATLDVLFLGYRRLPFACSYLPIANPKVVWPGAITASLLLAYGFAYVERLALHTPWGTAVLCATLGLIVLVAKVADRLQRRERVTIDFREKPPLPTQRLGLFDHVASRD